MFHATHHRLGHPTMMGGFAMIEVLVSILILVLGLLGIAGLLARSNTAEMESYQRVQALILLQDMVDRMNANRKVIDCYSDGANGRVLGSAYNGTPACTAGNTQQKLQAVNDLSQWNSLLQGSATVSASTKVGAMIGAVGCIKQLDATNDTYLVSVAWQGLASTAAPNPGNDCGKDLYGAETLRRVVTRTLRIANLS